MDRKLSPEHERHRRAAEPGGDAVAPGPFQPFRRERLGDLIYGELLEQIVAGRFPEGEKLPTENALAKLFRVSRPVIRNALTRLQGDGVVVTRRGVGTFVRRRPPRRLTEMTHGANVADIMRCMEARLSVEPEAARLAALRRTPADAERLRAAFEALRGQAARGGITPEADVAFHRLIAAASRNPYLLDIFDHLAGAIQVAVGVALGITRKGSHARSQRVVDEHERILEAVLGADPDSAALAMRYHLDQVRKRLMDGSREY